MTRTILLAAAATLGMIGSAAAGSATGSLPVKVHGRLAVVFNPTSATLTCDTPPGTVVAVVSVTGGNGNPVTLAASGDTTDFALSASASPANVVVALGGITSSGSSCATVPTTAAGTTDVFTVTATQ